MRSYRETWSTSWHLISGNLIPNENVIMVLLMCHKMTLLLFNTSNCCVCLIFLSVFWINVALCQPAWGTQSNTSRKRSPIFLVNAKKKRLLSHFFPNQRSWTERVVYSIDTIDWMSLMTVSISSSFMSSLFLCLGEEQTAELHRVLH